MTDHTAAPAATAPASDDRTSHDQLSAQAVAIVVDAYVDELMAHLGVLRAYDQAIDDLVYFHADLDDPAGQIDEQTQDEWASLCRALKAHIQTRVAALHVPVQVTIDLDTFRAVSDIDSWVWTVADRLLTEALQATTLPGDGRPTLDRTGARKPRPHREAFGPDRP